MPAPVRGLLANAAIFGTGPDSVESALWLYNLQPSEYGVRVRPGSREFATNIPDKDLAQGEVRTIMYYNSTTQGAVNDFVFAATSDGIYDITAGGAGPHTKVLDWTNKTDTAGWCEYQNFTNAAGDQFLLVCDEANGYWIFDGTTWARPTGLQPADPTAEELLVPVFWANRMWFVERDSANAWYTKTVDGIQGDLVQFNMGSNFFKGGHLVAIGVWTVDDGAGMDDKLVAVSGSGDVLVWNAPGGDVANISLVGRWYVGEVPEGRRVFSRWGGDIAILSSMGVIQLTSLLGGSASINHETYVTKNISRYMRLLMDQRRHLWGWQMELNPRDNSAIISVPNDPADTMDRWLQMTLSVNTGAWCTYRDLPMVCMNKSNAGFRFGTKDGRVMTLDGTVDNANLAGDYSETIKFSMLSHYTSMGRTGHWKQIHMTRPYFVGEGLPVYDVQVRYDFDLSEVTENPPFISLGISRWDEAIWDQDLWGGDAQTYVSTNGEFGMGRHVAIAMRGETASSLFLAGFDIMVESGGLL